MNTSRWASKPADPTPQAATQPPTNLPEHKTNEQHSQTIPSYISDEPIDEFAQTRPPDDLFDDDFTPLDQPAAPEPVEPIHTSADLTSAPPSQTISAPSSSAPRVPRGPRRGGLGPHGPSATTRTQNGTNENEPASADSSAATQPRSERREAAVRGDRSGTGGLKREKLTEEELSAKLEAMKIKNATLMEKHARSQADEESFYAREALAAQRRKEERVNRQQMMGERERNRLRKLQAQGGREWDMEKDEKEFAAVDGRKARRGAFGGITGDRQPNASSPDTATNARPANTSSRGRGGRRGRGGFNEIRSQEHSADKKSEKQTLPSAADFPELPAAVKVPQSSDAGPVTLEFPGKKAASCETTQAIALPIAGHKQSWADEVEAL